MSQMHNVKVEQKADLTIIFDWTGDLSIYL